MTLREFKAELDEIVAANPNFADCPVGFVDDFNGRSCILRLQVKRPEDCPRGQASASMGAPVDTFSFRW